MENKITKVFPDFENELKAIDGRLTVVRNPNFPHLANIKLNGKDITPIPSEDIKDEIDPTYTMTFPNGMCAPHRSKSIALALVNDTIKKLEDKDYHDAFFGVGAYK